MVGSSGVPGGVDDGPILEGLAGVNSGASDDDGASFVGFVVGILVPGVGSMSVVARGGRTAGRRSGRWIVG